MAPSQRPANRSARKRVLVIAAAGLLVIVTIAGVAIYRDQVAPFRATVIVVNETALDMRYVLKRTFMAGQEPLAVLQALTFEELIKQRAPASPYNIVVSELEVDAFVRQSARGGGAALSDAEFAAWYRQQLNESRLTEAEYRDLARTRLLSARLGDYLGARLPTVAEQVHLYVIAQASLDAARKTRARLAAGEDFFRLARELNDDPELAIGGGDLGWFARNGLPPQLGRIAFEDLETGKPSDPLPFDERRYAILLVAERAAARQIPEDALAVSKGKVLNEWMTAEFARNRIEYRGFTGGYDSDTDAWIKAQLAKMKAAGG